MRADATGNDNEFASLRTGPFGIVLHEVVTSFVLTGESSRYWTSYFLNDESGSRFNRGQMGEDGVLDPITFQKTELSRVPPRVYFIQCLVSQLEKITACQRDILAYLKWQVSYIHRIPVLCNLGRRAR